MLFSDFYHTFYYCGLIIATLVNLFYFKKATLPFKFLGLLICATAISELTAKYMSFVLYKPNSVVYHIFTPIEYSLYVVIFSLLLHNKHWNKFLWLSIIVLAISEILNTIFFQPLSETNTNIMIAESVLLVSLSLILFIRIRETPLHQNILREGVFWFNSAVLCYYAFNILIWGFHNLKVYLLSNPPTIIYDANLVISGLLYLAYGFAIALSATNRNKIVITNE